MACEFGIAFGYVEAKSQAHAWQKSVPMHRNSFKKRQSNTFQQYTLRLAELKPWCAMDRNCKNKQKTMTLSKTNSIRHLLLIILIYNGLLAFGQEKAEPRYFLNSKEIEIKKVMISKKSIDNIEVKGGDILINTKNSKFKHYTLKDIILQDTKLNYEKDNIAYRIIESPNSIGKLITDTSGIKIDTSYYISVNIESISELKYLPIKTPLFIVNIKLDTILEESRIYVKKPVIYLYPQQEKDISLKLEFSGKLKTTYPAYNDGWKVHVFPSGEMKNLADGKEYSYLFWDGLIKPTQEQASYEDGYVISNDTALQFLQNILPKLGLKTREYNDFIVYWLPYLQAHRFTFIHFRTGEDYDVISRNLVVPKPDSQIRIFMEFKAVESEFKVKAQVLSKPERRGFTLVEWGGAELNTTIKIKTLDGDYLNR